MATFVVNTLLAPLVRLMFTTTAELASLPAIALLYAAVFALSGVLLSALMSSFKSIAPILFTPAWLMVTAVLPLVTVSSLFVSMSFLLTVVSITVSPEGEETSSFTALVSATVPSLFLSLAETV